MKKTFEFTCNEKEYVIKNINPNEKREAFTIDKKEMQFDTNQFYQYVFSDVNTKIQIDIIDKTENDNATKRLYAVISEITSGVIDNLKQKCLVDSN
ncbi:MAG: hypothetical protein RSD88_06270 [Anaerovoracaceae bacterium]